jgi:NADH dehydrogenase
MKHSEICVVTGAFGYTGKYIAIRLLNEGYEVRTLTNSIGRSNPFNGSVKAYPYNFNDIDKLTSSLEGASVLFNNYWVRFNHKNFSFSDAIKNSLVLFEAAKRAGIKKIVHISITNPSEDSPFEYFRGKAILEHALIESGIPYVILRPAVIFGKEDILINNIAWFLRKFPVFGVFGSGEYKLQPIYVEDLAELAVEASKTYKNRIIDAIGPETYTYKELVREISSALGLSRPIISIPPQIGYLLGKLAGIVLGDVVITQDEIKGLMSNLLFTDSPPTGKTKFSEWIKCNAETLGLRYSNELNRRSNRDESYLALREMGRF